MKESVFEDLFEIGFGQNFRHLRAVNARGGDRIIIGDLDGIDIFQHKHTLRRAAPNHARHVDAPSSGEVRGERFGVFAFSQIINLTLNGGFQFRNQRADVHALADRPIAHQPPANPAKRRKIHVNQLVDERTLDFDNNIAELFRLGRVDFEAGAVNLTQSGGCQRIRFKIFEYYFEWRAKFSLSKRADCLEILCWHFILQARKFLGDLNRQDVKTRG